MVVHDQQARGRGLPASAQHEARFAVRATQGVAGIPLRTHQIPGGGVGLKRHVAAAAGGAGQRPLVDGAHLAGRGRVERAVRGGRQPLGVGMHLAQTAQAQVVAAALDQAALHLGAEDALHQRQVMRHELLLQVDGGRGDHHPLVVGVGPGHRRYQVGERLADAGTRLGRHDHLVVERVACRLQQRNLAGSLLESGMQPVQRAAGAQGGGQLPRVEQPPVAARRRLGDHVDAGHRVVDDAESLALVAHPAGNCQIRRARLQQSGGMVVDQQIRPVDVRGEHRDLAVVAARGDGDGAHQAVRVAVSDAEHLLTGGLRDGGPQRAGRGRGEPRADFHRAPVTAPSHRSWLLARIGAGTLWPAPAIDKVAPEC